MLQRSILGAFIFLIPLHAFMVTVLDCRFGVPTDFLRFWKELIILWFLIVVSAQVLIKNKFSVSRIYKNNYLLGTITAFTICSLFYIYFPFFEIKAAAILGFRYDVIFLLALLVWLYLNNGRENLSFYIKTLSISTFGILIVFLPWYVFGDISSTVKLFGYSPDVSTYTAGECLTFSQNVDGHHRFQATFGGPIRFSVFLTIVFSLFAGFIMSRTTLSQNRKYLLLAGFGALVIPSIFFSYSKTSALGLMFAIGLFVYLGRRFVYWGKITKRFLQTVALIVAIPLWAITAFKWELFLHLWAVLNRVENLSKSIEMFFYNPIGYGLGIAGPASQIGNSIESAWNWQIATATTTKVHRFLPENWYVQILLEQGIVGFALFMAVVLIIGFKLWEKVKTQKDFMSIGIFTAYLSLCFMANFTHAFEEAATSYVLFLFIGIYLADTIKTHVHKK